MRSLFTPVIAALLATLLVGAPVAANPPERTHDPWFGEFYDPATNTFVLANITGEAWCDWALGGFVGDPDLIAPTDVMAVPTRSGATVYRFHATWQLEAYRYPIVAESPEEECALMAEHGIWATGHVTITYTDNDLDVSGPGANAFGWSMNGSLTDGTGESYRFKRLFRAQIVGGEFFVRVNELSIR
jgi:hypothetical protein